MEKSFEKLIKYPSPKESFNFTLKPIEEIRNSALVTLDTSALLLPFDSDGNITDGIEKVYKDLAEDNRIFLPSHAVREYLDNRAEKITNLHTTLEKIHQAGFNYFKGHPLLGGSEEYESIKKAESKLKESLKKYKTEIKKSIDLVEGWGWNDPISKMYHDILGDRVLKADVNKDEITKDLARRNEHKIPPGYKDQSKNLNREGDLIIWHEILNLAKEKQKDMILVTNDEKQDWFHQSNKKGLYPRFELVDEFRETTGGYSFHIITLSKLLELYDSDKRIIESVKSTEEVSKSKEKYDLSLLGKTFVEEQIGLGNIKRLAGYDRLVGNLGEAARLIHNPLSGYKIEETVSSKIENHMRLHSRIENKLDECNYEMLSLSIINEERFNLKHRYLIDALGKISDEVYLFRITYIEGIDINDYEIEIDYVSKR